MPQLTGIVRVKVNGRTLQSKPGASLKVGGPARTAQKGHAVYGYTEAVEQSRIEATYVHRADVDLIEDSNLVDAVVIFETDTGDSYLQNAAFVVEGVTLTGGEGEVSIAFEGDPAERL